MMIKIHKNPAVLLALLMIVSGCLQIPTTDEGNQWSLSMGGHDEEIQDGYRFTGEVALGGYYSGVSVTGVQVELLDKKNETLKTVFVGTLNASRSPVDINVTVERRPKYVLVFVSDIVAPQRENEKPGISGLRRVENSDYYSYTNYNPYAVPNETKS